MLEVPVLRAADVYAWLGCQKTAARQLGCNQATVSRRAREAARLGSLRSVWGEEDFLQLERRVHQHWRFSRSMDLRVHVYRWIHPQLQRRLPPSWTLNPSEVPVTRVAPLELLRLRVIDALLAPGPLVASLDASLFAAVPLYSAPLLLLTSADGVLRAETGLSAGDIASASRLEMLDFVPSLASACSRELDGRLFTSPPDSAPGSGAHSLGRRFWGTPLTPLVRADLQVLDFPPVALYREFLVCRREWLEHGEIQRLLLAVRQALLALPGQALSADRIEIP